MMQLGSHFENGKYRIYELNGPMIVDGMGKRKPRGVAWLLGGDSDRAEAYAKLFAASPEMFALCEAMAECYRPDQVVVPHRQTVLNAKALIAQVKP